MRKDLNDDRPSSAENERALLHKLQWGCNPNSSSIGSMVFAVPPMLFFVFVAYAVIGFAILCRCCRRKDDPPQSEEDE